MSQRPKPVVLTILDGWGFSEETQSNAISAAHTPVWDRLWRDCPHTLVQTSGPAVGLPAGQMGNSEVGHLNIGAGRVVYQDFTRIGQAVRSGSFCENRTLVDAVDRAIAGGGSLHVFGLLSPGGVHSHEEHIHALVQMAAARGCERIRIHAFLDGRDTPPKSAAASLELLLAVCREAGAGEIASISGRFYAMDRDNRWDRIARAYDMLTRGEAAFIAADPLAALEAAYARDETDEFVQPTLIAPSGAQPVRIVDGDVVVFMNYRADRAREITRAFTEPGFDRFARRVVPRLAAFVTLTEYAAEFDLPVAFPPERLSNGFGEYIARLGLHQLRLAETEKYAHVTFFFNGGREEPFDGEERILVPSPKVATYDQQPEMSAVEVTDHLVAAIESGRFDAIICNYANPDMVGHTGNVPAAVKAVETIDVCLGRITDALREVGGEMLITADHGNVEQMADTRTGQAHTAHTVNPVPLIYVGRNADLLADGALCDIAPTLLQLMALPQPTEMTGHGLIRLAEAG